MFGKTRVYECTFSSVNFMNSKYRSNIANENNVQNEECSKYKIPDCGLVQKMNVKFVITNFYIDYMLK